MCGSGHTLTSVAPYACVRRGVHLCSAQATPSWAEDGGINVTTTIQGKQVSVSRTVSGNTMTITLTVEDTTAVRTFTRQAVDLGFFGAKSGK